MLPWIGLVAPYAVGYLLGWCLTDFHFKYKNTSKWIVAIWKTLVGVLVMIVCVIGFRMFAESAIQKDLDSLRNTDHAYTLMEDFADAYTAEHTANRYIFLLEANRELIRKQNFNKLYKLVLTSDSYLKFMRVSPVYPPISEKLWEEAVLSKDPDWESITQGIINEVRKDQLKRRS